jgi:hypothetical protein
VLLCGLLHGPWRQHRHRERKEVGDPGGDDLPDAHLVADGGQLRVQVLQDHDDLDPRVLELVRKLPLRVQGVVANHHRAQPERGVIPDHVLGAVRQDQTHPVA